MPRERRQQADYSRAVRERIRGSRFPAGSRPAGPKPLRPRTVKPARAKRETSPQPARTRFHDATPTAPFSGPLDVLATYLADVVPRGVVAVMEDARMAMERCLRCLSPDELHELWDTRHVNTQVYHLSYIPRRHLRLRGAGTIYDTQALTGRMQAEPYAARLAVVEAVCRDLRIRPTTYDGLGPLAAAWLRRFAVKACNWRADAGTCDRFARAYYGGRVEGIQHGRWDGPVYHYDLASAYPWAMTLTPRMGPRWERCDPSDGLLYKVAWHDRFATPFHALPFRQADGSLCWPAEGTAYIWKPEYLQAIGFHVEALEAWRPVGAVDDYPLTAPMRELYRWRQWYEDRGEPDHAALVKGVMQACHGKLMQQWSADSPAYNLAWAGYSTSLVRAELYALAATDPGAVIALQTDAIWSTRRLAVAPWFGGLGRWRETVYPAGAHHFAPTAGQYRIDAETEGRMGLAEPITDAEWAELDRADRFSLTRWAMNPVSLGRAVRDCTANTGGKHTCAERLGRGEPARERIPARATGQRTTGGRIGTLWQTTPAVVRGESAPYPGGSYPDTMLMLDDLSDGARGA